MKQIMKDPDYDPAFREILLNARLALVLGDHYFSSLDGDAKQDDGKWSARDLWANTFSFRNKKRKSEKNQFSGGAYDGRFRSSTSRSASAA